MAKVRYFFRHGALLEARLDLGLTQEQLAQSLRIDVRTYRRYESGEVNDGAAGFAVQRAGRRQLLARMGEELGLAAEELLETRTASEPAAPRSQTLPVHALQPARHFLGRDAELQALTRWVGEASAPPNVQAIVAVGGAGKSALVERVLSQLEEASTLPVVVWSFYDDRRVGGLLAAVLRHLGEEVPEAPLDRLERALLAMRRTRQLWVLDGLEVLQSTSRPGGGSRPRGAIEDVHLRRLLTAIAAGDGTTRALLTSRVAPLDLEPWQGAGFDTLALQPLAAAAQHALLRRWGVRGTDAELTRHLERLGGHALSVATFGSYVSSYHDGQLGDPALLDLRDAAADDLLAFRLERLLGAYAEALTTRQRDLLATVSLFPHGVDVDTLLELAAPDAVLWDRLPSGSKETVRTLSRLEALGLVYRNREATSAYSAHPFVAGHFKTLLGETAPRVHDARRAWLQQRLAEQPSAAAVSERQELLEELYTHTVLAGRVADALSLYQVALGGHQRLGLERGDMAAGMRLLRMLFIDGDPHRARPGLAVGEQAAVLYELALYASAIGDPALALTCLQQAQLRVREQPRFETTCHRTMAYVLRLQGRYDEALAALQQALRVGAQEPDHQARNQALRAAVLHDLGRLEDARAAFEAAAALESRPLLRRSLWMAEHLLECGEPAAAERLTRQNREACLDLGWGGHISHCNVVLGHCVADDEPDEAQRLLDDARVWANRSGEVEAQLRCHELALRLARGGEAEVEIRQAGVALAQSAGFGRFVERLSRAS